MTKEEVRRVAHQYLTPDKAAIVVVGDAQAAIEQIKPFTEDFEIYSSSGKRKISPATRASKLQPSSPERGR
ncbi:MAG: hypothetical protein WKF84_17530 [Pyrinomonadaceae bacterium]